MLSLACVFVVSSLGSFADRTIVIPARVFASLDGGYGLNIVRASDDVRTWNLRLFQPNPDGTTVTRWECSVAGYPRRAMVGPRGEALLFDCGEQGGDSSVLVIASDGSVLKKWALDDLLTEAEIREHVTKTISGRLWRKRDVSCEFAGDRALVSLEWGKVLAFDLRSGAMVSTN